MSRRKIGILTTHRANNFGAVLQAFSLVSACLELGVDAEIIDWRNPYFEELYHKMFRPGGRIKYNLARAISFWSFALPMRCRYSKFRRLIPSGHPIFERSKLVEESAGYDAFIVGSDQVWNPRNSARGDPHGFDRTNLLDFVGTKPRYAYAASIGTDGIKPADLLPEFKAAWEKFSLITMREYEGAEYVSSILGRKVDAVLDPVMLHDAKWWTQWFSTRPLPNRRYVFVYNLHHSAEMKRYAQKLADGIGGEVVSVMIGHSLHKWSPGMLSVGPAEFLKLLANANAVVTSSFHASAFSAIFGKELYLSVEQGDGNPNTRFSSFSRFTGLKGDEICRSGDTSWIHFDCSCLDMTALSAARDFSLSKLKSMVG